MEPSEQPGDPRETVRRLLRSGDGAPLPGELVFIRTRIGRLEAGTPKSATLPRRLRMLLMLIDGRRSVADLRNGLTRFRSLDECLDMLGRMGLIEPLPPRWEL